MKCEKQNCSYPNWQEELSRSPTLAMIFVPESVMYKSLKQNNKGFGSAPNYGPNWSGLVQIRTFSSNWFVPQRPERNTKKKWAAYRSRVPSQFTFLYKAHLDSMSEPPQGRGHCVSYFSKVPVRPAN